MLCIGICQTQSDWIARVLCDALTNFGIPVIYCDGKPLDLPNHTDDATIAIFAGAHLAESDVPFDLGLFAPEYNANSVSFSAKIVVAPDTLNPSLIQTCALHHVVTYGLCRKNTVTVSSLIDGKLVVSIQRDIVTLSDAHVDEQEFHVGLNNPDAADAVLAVVTSLLLLDVSIEQISALTFLA